MNILHMKYAVEVAKAGSINKASEELLIAQPNLSRSVKELEADLGITIFERSAQGMVLTPDGEEFIRHAREILRRIDEVEELYKGGLPMKRRFSVSGPRASYISRAFVRFSKQIGKAPAEVFYRETNARRTIKNVLSSDYKLGILRYAERHDSYFKSLLEEKGLASQPITEFRYVLLMHRDSELTKKEALCDADLLPFIEVAHGDPFVPSLPTAQVMKEELSEEVARRIYVFERASQFELLAENPETFMWVSPLPEDLLKRYGLVQREVPANERVYRDMLIYRKEYRLTELDMRFIAELHRAKEEYI